MIWRRSWKQQDHPSESHCAKMSSMQIKHQRYKPCVLELRFAFLADMISWSAQNGHVWLQRICVFAESFCMSMMAEPMMPMWQAHHASIDMPFLWNMILKKTSRHISNASSTNICLDFWVQGGFLYSSTAFKCEKNEIGISFSSWDPNGHKFVILASSSSRDLANPISQLNTKSFWRGDVSGH